MSNPSLPAWRRQALSDRAEAYKHVSLETYARLVQLRKIMTQAGSPGINIVQSTEELDIILQALRTQLGTEADIYVQGQHRR